ncbi:tagaturonate reductase [Tunicatimonas pelagia]|uniref:tagaturonate reductase n=1 Tax=Tunicatimonas pelagia TaxID=931531 RepID=UPI0026668FF5|nr:tagaturonate reductase [Tunicatimonas pelagia]WKN45590.1 tagaturonate reductase [Tunicatimonas pelagia]
MPILSKKLIASTVKQFADRDDVQFPDPRFFRYPDRIIQFGSGVLLRGLIEYFVDEANRQDLFKGRVVIVNSTRSGRGKRFANQNGLFTICEEGFYKGQAQRKFYINSSVSRALPAADYWHKVLECAHNESITTVVSNTTEVGITLQEDDNLLGNPPASFPGKLTAFLYERYRAFGGLPKSGMLIIPTELLIDNGSKLKSIVLRLVELNQLEDEFRQWIEQNCLFCNTLVDRIVPGEPSGAKQAALEEYLGFQDELLTVSEVYRFLAIEGKKEELYQRAPFLKADSGIVVDEDITAYRERKLRILNGGHTISVAAGFLCGLETVDACMQDEVMGKFISQVIYEEIIPTLAIDRGMAQEFADDVLDRFRNPYLHHQLISIALQYTSKMNMRNGLTFDRYFKKMGEVPKRMCAGLATYMLFSRPVVLEGDTYYGEFRGKKYPIKDDQAAFLHQAWQGVDLTSEADIEKLVQKILTYSPFWSQDMRPFIKQTAWYLRAFADAGVRNVLASVVN